MKDDGWSRKNIRKNIVQKLSYNEIGAFSQSDDSSIMK